MKLTKLPSPRHTALIATLLGLGAIAFSAFGNPPYRLVFNPSESAPRGWYLLIPQSDLKVGMKVLARLPSSAAAFAAARGYLPLEVPILKPIAAIGGQKVCDDERDILIDAQRVARAREFDGAVRPLPHWNGCRILNSDEVFLLSRYSTASFDSRYFGPVQNSTVIGRVIPLWTW